MFIRPRAYVDWTVPTDGDGNEVGLCTEDISYRSYLEWLADYLFETEIAVPESQKALLEEYKEKGASHAILDLSDLLGYTIYETEAIQEMSARGAPYSERYEAEREGWDALTEEEREVWDEGDFFTPEEVYNRLGVEHKESKKVPSHIRHADIPYRPVLAALFKDVHDVRKRYELLDFFYCNFNESASK
ncbi:MAG: hypothetical protein P1U86_18310 [Verrucomicrobiales bacterium]|nr:hypothetical protein [Verrucomicrobiales bacterium]